MNQSITMREKISYGIGAIGKDIVYMFVSGYILYYYNTVLGISSTFTGVMMMVARVLDALNDPLMGVIVEKTKTKFGKFRPWIFSGSLINAFVIYGMFAMPKSLSGTAVLVYASAMYILWGTTYTLMDIPFWSMIPAITKAGKERESLSVIGRTCASIGGAIPTVGTMLLVTRFAGGEREGFRVIALWVAIAFVIAEAVCVMGLKEQPTEKQEVPSVKEMMEALFSNDQALVVAVSIVLFNASLYLTSQLALYFFKYDIGNTDLQGVFAMLGGGAQMLSMVCLPLLRKKWNTMDILVGSMGVTMVGYAALFIMATLSVKSIPLLATTAFIIYIGFGCATVLTTIFLADSVDYGEWKNGKRNESVIFSMQTFVVQLASAFSVLIAGVGIDLIGLDINASVQTTQTLFGLRFMMAGIPVVGLITSLIYFKKHYILTEEKNAEIAADLANRKVGVQ